jgi:hypothetical protein
MLSWFSGGIWMIPLYAAVFILFVLVVAATEVFFDARARSRYNARVRRYHVRRRF